MKIFSVKTFKNSQGDKRRVKQFGFQNHGLVEHALCKFTVDGSHEFDTQVHNKDERDYRTYEKLSYSGVLVPLEDFIRKYLALGTRSTMFVSHPIFVS